MAAKSIEELRSSLTAKFEELDHKIVAHGESMQQMMAAFFQKLEQKLELVLSPTVPAAHKKSLCRVETQGAEGVSEELRAFDEMTGPVPAVVHSFSNGSLFGDEGKDDSSPIKVDNQLVVELKQLHPLKFESLRDTQQLFDEMTGPISIKHNDEDDSHENLVRLTIDLLKILSCREAAPEFHSLKLEGLKNAQHVFDKMPSHLNVELGIGKVLMVVFDPGGSSWLHNGCDAFEPKPFSVKHDTPHEDLGCHSFFKSNGDKSVTHSKLDLVHWINQAAAIYVGDKSVTHSQLDLVHWINQAAAIYFGDRVLLYTLISISGTIDDYRAYIFKLREGNENHTPCFFSVTSCVPFELLIECSYDVVFVLVTIEVVGIDKAVGWSMCGCVWTVEQLEEFSGGKMIPPHIQLLRQLVYYFDLMVRFSSNMRKLSFHMLLWFVPSSILRDYCNMVELDCPVVLIDPQGNGFRHDLILTRWVEAIQQENGKIVVSPMGISHMGCHFFKSNGYKQDFDFWLGNLNAELIDIWALGCLHIVKAVNATINAAEGLAWLLSSLNAQTPVFGSKFFREFEDALTSALSKHGLIEHVHQIFIQMDYHNLSGVLMQALQHVEQVHVSALKAGYSSETRMHHVCIGSSKLENFIWDPGWCVIFLMNTSLTSLGTRMFLRGRKEDGMYW